MCEVVLGSGGVPGNVVSPVTPKTEVPSDARPPDPQMPDRGFCPVGACAAQPAVWVGFVMLTATIQPL